MPFVIRMSAKAGRSVKLVALTAPLAALSIIAACSESATTTTPTLPATGAPSAQIATAAGGSGGSPKSAGVRAYAYVNPDQLPLLDAARTRGFTAVSRPASGVYCFTPPADVSPETAPALVSVVDANASDKSAEWSMYDFEDYCPAGQYRVTTYGPVGRMSTLSFTILVP